MQQNNIIIFGDSYSTFDGFIPDGYDVYYSKANRDGTGVTDVTQTWWHMLAREANLNLVLNDSWSGSTMGHTGYENADCSKTSSFIFRLRQMIENGFFRKNEIHKVFVFGGTNDNCCGATLGEAKFESWVEDDLFFVLPAIAYFLHFLKKTLPQAEIYCLINTDLRPELTNCMKTACEKYDITPVTFENIEKILGHPSVQGMKDIKNTLLKVMCKQAAE